MNDDKSLLERLQNYSRSGHVPMHMPGHKRNTEKFPWLSALGGELDLTEISGFDDLNRPESFYREMNARWARLRRAAGSVCLVGGSTCGVLAAFWLTCRGKAAIVARGCHKSVYNAVEVCRARPRYVVPELAWGQFYGAVSPEDIEKALDMEPDAGLVCITSPTYEGIVSDVAGIARVCRSHGVPLFVDGAHGAHLGLGGFPAGAMEQGADLCVESLHKTLPSLTQTAALSFGPAFSQSDVQAAVSVFQSSSPSYILAASMDRCIRFLEENPESVSAWHSLVTSERPALSRLRLLEREALDPSKYTVLTGRAGITGFELGHILRREYSIEPELCAPGHVVLMTGLGDSEESVGALCRALEEIDRQLPEKSPAQCETLPPLPVKVLEPWEAALHPAEKVLAEDAGYRLSGDYVWAYPPGAPILVPGELISPALAGYLKGWQNRLKCSSGSLEEGISCLK
ncbi:MAG: aminotransferase class I/II-fold pyridoxal phosphate-dependent enzyme [Oscillospiraceae bacterium]|nr:aminotransferase class I/II-fold pyridoxal phosphate-dependent enzyme [Oscillospiraceae bacterium]